jgi:DNA polymerase-3 subunit delta'
VVSDPFSSLLGQPQAIQLLTAALRRQRIAPAYLFVGAAGIGRRLAARIFAAELLQRPHASQPRHLVQQRIADGNHPDLLWVQPTYLHQGQLLTAAEAEEQGLKRRTPPQIRLEQIRRIAQFLGRPPLEAPRSVVILDDAHTMAEAAANGLLKTLEEPGQATLILIAPSVDSLLPTLVSRCQPIPFRRLTPEAIAQVLTQIGQAEILHQPEVLALAQGSPGEAIAHWQHLQTIAPEILDAIATPPAHLRAALDLARTLASQDPDTQLWLVGYWQQRLWAARYPVAALQALDQARRALLSFVQPRLVWEVTMMALLER